jgi:cytochrome P450
VDRSVKSAGQDGIGAPDLASPAFKANPYPFYARLRVEAPVWRATLRDRRTAWLVTRYEDVARVLKDDTLAKDKLNAMDPEQRTKTPWVPGFLKPLERNMLDLDDPDHARLRALVSKAFTPRLIEQLRGRIEALCEELLDHMQRVRGRWDGTDLVAGYALPLPATVIAELLGVPAEDHARFHQWSNRLVSVSSGHDMLRAIPAAHSFVRYLRNLVERRRADPEYDLITALIRAEEAGDKLSEDELLAMAFLLLVAGHETTVNLIASGMLALLEHPGQAEKLRRDPSLVKPAVENSCATPAPWRWRPSATRARTRRSRARRYRAANWFWRCSARPTATSGISRTPTPSTSRAIRTGISPSGGVHHCLGAPLARMEGQIALNALLRRFPGARLAPETLRWRRGLFLRGLERLPLVL